ncbi:MAG TPA: cysteine--1-D-myo-inosityl 2-amino-2-deoxy-alpha-D-glucopyranoside ligase [Trebonia sp.]
MDAWRAAEVPVLPGRGPEPRLHDTATGELTAAAAGATASLYACGITPYDATHMGHAATFTAWDLLIRAWLDAGHDVIYTQNVTDVDDPLLERAERDGDDWRQLAERETERYREDMEALRVLPPAHLIGAVEALSVIDRFAERLAVRGALYDLDGDVYFARDADPSFGELSGPDTPSGLSVAQMTALFGERGGDPDRPGKKDPLDPLVWRAERQGEPAWGSRLGRGRPGWHVECAAIAVEYLGDAFDVQAGGSDLVFPHHEMSASHVRVACSAPASEAGGRVFARVYAHSGMVAYQGAKMSKSLGNLVFVSRLRESGTDPMAIRLALIAHHYRSDWEWTDAVLATAQRRLSRWRAATSPAAASPAASSPGTASHAGPASTASDPAASASTPSPGNASSAAGAGTGTPTPDVPAADAGPGVPAAAAVLSAVRERLADDLDAPGALAVIDAWADAVLAAPPGSVPPADARLVRDTADALLGVAL